MRLISNKINEVTTKAKKNFAGCCRPCEKVRDNNQSESEESSSSDEDEELFEWRHDKIKIRQIDLTKYYAPEILQD